MSRVAASTITPFNRATKSPLYAEPGRVHEHVITPAFFATYGMAMREGRDFDRRDAANAPRVAIVSESYARRFFPGRRALGETACDPPRGGGCTVVGVVADAVSGPPRSGVHPTIYLPLAQAAGVGPPGRTEISISVRSGTASPVLLARSVAEALTRINPNLSFSYRPLERDVNDALTQERLVAALSAFFGGLALLLSALGLYGVTAYVVGRRRAEIGLRLALGATPGAVIRLVLARIAAIVLVGLVSGAAVAFWLSKFVAALLYDIAPGDPMTIAAAATVLTVVTGLAAGIPAFHASRIDPATVLREN